MPGASSSEPLSLDESVLALVVAALVVAGFLLFPLLPLLLLLLPLLLLELVVAAGLGPADTVRVICVSLLCLPVGLCAMTVPLAYESL